MSWLPGASEFFPPTPKAWALLFNMFRAFLPLCFLLWTPAGSYQWMGKTSTTSKLNLPGRYAWLAAEVVGPINLLFILYTLPTKLYPTPHDPTSFLGTGLTAQQEILGLLYVLHYINRAIVTPLFLAPSMSPIHASITLSMAIFQYVNSSNIACWIVYGSENMKSQEEISVLLLGLVGFVLFSGGLAGNIRGENKLFELRRGAAKRKAKSEGKAVVTYDKVYVIPPATGMYKTVLYPHFVAEWIEWTGYWMLGGALGLGWGNSSAALWFVLLELATMVPRTVTGKQWYEQRFGKRAVAGRAGSIPLLGL